MKEFLAYYWLVLRVAAGTWWARRAVIGASSFGVSASMLVGGVLLHHVIISKWPTTKAKLGEPVDEFWLAGIYLVGGTLLLAVIVFAVCLVIAPVVIYQRSIRGGTSADAGESTVDKILRLYADTPVEAQAIATLQITSDLVQRCLDEGNFQLIPGLVKQCLEANVPTYLEQAQGKKSRSAFEEAVGPVGGDASQLIGQLSAASNYFSGKAAKARAKR